MRKRAIELITGLLATGLVSVAMPSRCLALTWTLNNVELYDGGNITGSFDFNDNGDNTYTNIDIFITAPATVGTLEINDPTGGAPLFIGEDSYLEFYDPSIYSLTLNFTGSLTGEDGTTDYLTFGSNLVGIAENGYNDNVVLSGEANPNVTAGSPAQGVPFTQPGMETTTVLGALIGLGVLRKVRKFKSNTRE